MVRACADAQPKSSTSGGNRYIGLLQETGTVPSQVLEEGGSAALPPRHISPSGAGGQCFSVGSRKFSDEEYQSILLYLDTLRHDRTVHFLGEEGDLPSGL